LRKIKDSPHSGEPKNYVLSLANPEKRDFRFCVLRTGCVKTAIWELSEDLFQKVIQLAKTNTFSCLFPST